MPQSLWSRLRHARLVRVLAVYVAASWIILQVVAFFVDRFGVPSWFMPAALILLVIGLVILLATAWVQSHPHTPRRAAAEEVPHGWELELKDLGQSIAHGKMPHLTWARAAFGGVIAFALLFGLAGLYVVIKDRGRTFAPGDAVAEAAAPGIAVLPFEVKGPGLDVWREGVIDLVSTNIDGAAGLRAIDSRTVLARWREAAPRGEAPDLATALEVARRAGARYALLGSAVALGRNVRLTADVYDVRSGKNLGQSQVEGAPDSVYALVDRLSIGVLQTVLGGRAEDLPRVDLARITTTSLPALRAYLEGEVLYRRGDYEAAIPAYQRAVEADSTFALALARLADSYGWVENVESDLAEQYLERAARFADRLPEREALLVRGNLALLRGNLDGLQLLRDGVRKYPDDPEMWYALADTYYHLGPQALVPDQDALSAFDRAIALDPSMSQLYIHPIQYAFGRADSAGARDLIQRYGKVTEESGFLRLVHNAYALAWGDPGARAATDRALDTMDIADARRTLRDLRHPRFLPSTAERFSRLLGREDADWQMARLVFWSHLEQGKVQGALAALDDPKATPVSGMVITLHDLGLPVPEERVARALAFGPTDTLSGPKPFFAAAWAAERGRWDDYQRAVARAESDAERFRAGGDSTGERFTRGMLRAMEGLAAWRRGRLEEAATLLEVGRREATGYGYHEAVNEAIRIHLGRVYMELGRPREAIPYLRSFYPYSPIANLRLAPAYEAAGETARAKESYELFLDAWRDADPDPAVQRLVADARAGLARLGFRPRG